MPILVETGADAQVDPARLIDSSLLGHRYTGFRSFNQFQDQVTELSNGLIGWPGGYLAEDRDDIFGLEYAETGLANPVTSFRPIDDILAFAVENGHGLAVTLPTMHWYEDLDGLRVQTRLFMEKLLGGDFGPLPGNFILEIGSEYYGHAPHLGMTADELAPIYGQISSVMIEEIVAARENPEINIEGVDVGIGVQGGRSGECSCRIAEAMTPETIAEIDYVVLSRLPTNFSGVDWGMPAYTELKAFWDEAIAEAGGEPPDILLASFNVASPTRSEALAAYEATLAEAGSTADVTDQELAERSDTDFEQFWQDRIERFDLGIDQPRVLMEIFAEFHAIGMSAGISFGTDQFHPGRISYTDDTGQPVSFIGMDFLHMLYDSVDGTTMLDVSLENTAADAQNVYAFQGEHHTTLFVMGRAEPADVALEIEGLTTDFTKVYVDTLTPEIPADWMDRYDIPDNPAIDESPEAETYAEGVEGTQVPEIAGSILTVSLTAPGQIVRIVLTHSAEGEEQVSDWVYDPASGLALQDDPVDAEEGEDDPTPDDDPIPGPDSDGGGLGGMLLLLLPVLALMGLG